MFRIGEFSKLAKTTIKTLRFYDEIDLFKPSFVDENGYRYYSIDDIMKIKFIVELRSYGLPIDDIKKVLLGQNEIEVLEKRKDELQKEIEESKINLSLIKKIINQIRKGEVMNKYQVNIKQIDECIVYYRKGVIESFAGIVPFVLEAGEEVRTNNPTLECQEPGYCYIGYLAREYQDKDIEIEYVEAVTRFGVESENIKFRKNKGVKVVSVLHKGSYSSIREAYAFALQYIKENSLSIVDDIRECYIHGCWDCESEADYETEIQVPIN